MKNLLLLFLALVLATTFSCEIEGGYSEICGTLVDVWEDNGNTIWSVDPKGSPQPTTITMKTQEQKKQAKHHKIGDYVCVKYQQY